MTSLSLLASAAASSESIARDAGEGFQVLVYGGELFIRVRAARELKRHGFSVETAIDEKSAQNAMARRSFDIVVAGGDECDELLNEDGAVGVVRLEDAGTVVDAVFDALWERKSEAPRQPLRSA